MTATVFAAFLRGVNLGARQVRSADLKACFEALGFAGVKTLLASGNVLFEAAGEAGLRQRLEAALEDKFGFPIGVVLRDQKALRAMVAENPFGSRVEDETTKLYVTFLDPRDGKSLPMPCKAEDFEVVRADPGEIYTLAFRMPNGRYGLGMEAIGRHFGKKTLWTARNWNTVVKAAG